MARWVAILCSFCGRSVRSPKGPLRMSLTRNGYAISDLVLSAAACERIAGDLPPSESRRGGVRHLLESRVVRAIVSDPRFAAAIKQHEDAALVAVKATMFDKTPAANWLVSWHQDRVVALAEKRDVAGFKGWTMKQGIPHAEAPRELLERMLAVRIHLDPASAENGPLRVIPGTHRRGKIGEDEITRIAETTDQAQLVLPQGSVLLMKPLLLHASSPSVRAGHRRVLHVELAPSLLPGGLRWHEVVVLAGT
jgi:hypothetical protein